MLLLFVLVNVGDTMQYWGETIVIYNFKFRTIGRGRIGGKFKILFTNHTRDGFEIYRLKLIIRTNA